MELKLILIGGATDGTETLKTIFKRLPAQTPPIVVVQHIHPVFSKAFADSLNTLCKIRLVEAKNSDLLQPNTAYIAPGGKQMKVLKSDNGYLIHITDGRH